MYLNDCNNNNIILYMNFIQTYCHSSIFVCTHKSWQTPTLGNFDLLNSRILLAEMLDCCCRLSMEGWNYLVWKKTNIKTALFPFFPSFPSLSLPFLSLCTSSSPYTTIIKNVFRRSPCFLFLFFQRMYSSTPLTQLLINLSIACILGSNNSFL